MRSTQAAKAATHAKPRVAIRATTDAATDVDALRIARRRDEVAELWTRGYSTAAIGRALGVSIDTARHDVFAIRVELQQEIVPSLQARIERSLAHRRAVQQSAWELFAKSGDTSLNKIGALNTILAAQDKIDEIEGVLAPERVNTAAIAEVWESVVATIGDVFGDEGLQTFLRIQRNRTRLSTQAGKMLPSGVVEADETKEAMR
jgi:hypothetical protein